MGTAIMVHYGDGYLPCKYLRLLKFLSLETLTELKLFIGTYFMALFILVGIGHEIVRNAVSQAP